MKKGISVWSMPAEWDYEKIFFEAAAAGFEGHPPPATSLQQTRQKVRWHK